MIQFIRKALSKTCELYIPAASQEDLERFVDENKDGTTSISLTIDGNIRGYKVHTFAILSRVTSLKTLHFKYVLTQEQFDQICQISSLENLYILGPDKLSKIDAISQLTNLKQLVISMHPSSNKYHTLPTIQPLADLKELEFLHLGAIKIASGNIEPLKKLTKLKEVHIASKYWDFIPELKATNPGLIIDIEGRKKTLKTLNQQSKDQ